jgi:hypothetical protein
VAFRLPARVFRALALAPTEGSLVHLSLGGRAKIRISSLKPGMGEMKLYNACIQTKET